VVLLLGLSRDMVGQAGHKSHLSLCVPFNLGSSKSLEVGFVPLVPHVP